ncbi:MAG: ATP-dependent sacrificial sulfur transferase LarE [Acidobacteriota bacterium]|nr:ATP-dependent sacrificial sulfur transferase LarE [Acidobacteriota bacterium]
MDIALQSKKDRALTILRREGSVVVALSGGVDSAVLLALAVEALGAGRVLAITGRSAAVPEDDVLDARAVAGSLGARHEVVETRELETTAYKANTGDRCYHCRSELFDMIRVVSSERGFGAIAYGAIPDDAGDFRPGMAAADERGVRAPLIEAGIDKSGVRALAAEYGLAVRDKPAAACLASRIPVGTEVTPERLAQVGRAEKALKEMGFLAVRVRHHGEIARLELDPEGDRRLADPGVRSAVVEAVKRAGFSFVALDLEGYRMGSLNPLKTQRIRPARDGGQ